MGKILILYQSKYGATKRYAGWLAEELGGDLLETKKARLEVVLPYDTIIFGGGIYASGIAGIGFLKRHYRQLGDKKLAVFAVGASPYDETAIKALRKRNLRELADIPLFYCRGAWREETMTWIDRLLCNGLKRMVARKDPADYEPWEEALMQAGTDCDWTDRGNIKPIVEWLQNS
ncbi:MAG: flavodoxin domain-containing protein [Limnochordia bacterium]|jgi:menaquinone-dependent protoporphyrinogen IX oxidase